MVEPIEQLRELLCEDEEINKDLEKTIYIVSTVWNKNLGLKGVQTHNNVVTLSNLKSREEALGKAISDFKNKKGKENYIFCFEVILEFPYEVEERHLRMYCDRLDIDIFEIKGLLLDGTKYKTFNKMPIIVRLNNTKNLEDQDPQVIEKVVKFLLNKRLGA